MLTRYILPLGCLLLSSLPLGAVTRQDAASTGAIWPDYRDVTIPPNIAPLSFRTAEGKVVSWDESTWRKMLAAHRGKDLVLEAEGLTITNHVSEYDIDPYLTYRLIPPGFSGFNEIGIWQRDLTSFAERPLYRNSQMDLKQCVNCHTYNRADPDEYLFHARAFAGGTQIVSKKYGERKVNLKAPGMIGAGVYPAWHPSGDYIAFSQNETRQLFYREHPDKIEVIDLRSDLVLYSLAENRIIPIETTTENFETFPTWSPDGTRLYSCRARTPFTTMPTNETGRAEQIIGVVTNLYYDLVVRDFDVTNLTFSPPRIVIDAQRSKCSVSLPRVSPDGRWLVMTVGPYGQFHIWHHQSDLWETDLKTGTSRPLTELNSRDVESYHTFSSNGRWLVFSSRRDDNQYTRPYFAAFDPATGRFAKPFLLPVKSPDDHLERMLSYNVPEFSTGSVKKSNAEMRDLVDRPAEPVGVAR